jgi:hypothetical protein
MDEECIAWNGVLNICNHHTWDGEKSIFPSNNTIPTAFAPNFQLGIIDLLLGLYVKYCLDSQGPPTYS